MERHLWYAFNTPRRKTILNYYFFFSSCYNIPLSIASRFITAPHWWCLLPSPFSASSILLSLCFIWTPVEMSAVAIHIFHHLAMILKTHDTGSLCSFKEMSGQIWAPTAPRGNILLQQTVRGCWSLPLTHFPRSDLLHIASGLYTPTWYVMPCGLQRDPDCRPVQQEEFATDPNRQANGGSLKPPGPRLFRCFFSVSTPCLATQSWDWLCRLNTQKAFLSRHSFAKWSLITWCWLQLTCLVDLLNIFSDTASGFMATTQKQAWLLKIQKISDLFYNLPLLFFVDLKLSKHVSRKERQTGLHFTITFTMNSGINFNINPLLNKMSEMCNKWSIPVYISLFF